MCGLRLSQNSLRISMLINVMRLLSMTSQEKESACRHAHVEQQIHSHQLYLPLVRPHDT